MRETVLSRLTSFLSCPFSAKQLHDNEDDSKKQKYVDRESCHVVDNKTAYPRAYQQERQQKPNESHLSPALRETTYIEKFLLVIG
ncbi:MAG: hypothetical protein WA621_04570 [Candidatus Acidiferrum sp.]|jgi:hypothetical protein